MGPGVVADGAGPPPVAAAPPVSSGSAAVLLVAAVVLAAPSGSGVAQVTLHDPEPGAGLVVSYRDPESHVALQVGRTGDTVQLVEVDGRRLQPRVLVVADPAAPLVLAVRRHVVTGVRPAATSTTFDDLVLGSRGAPRRPGCSRGAGGSAEKGLAGQDRRS